MSGWNWNTKLGLDEDLPPPPSRRNSVLKMFHRLRSGSLPGWINQGSSPATSNAPSPLVSRSHHPPPLPPHTSKTHHKATPTPIKKLPLPIVFGKRGMKSGSRESLPGTSSGNSSNTSTWNTTTGGNTTSTTAVCTDDAEHSPNDDEDEISEFHERLFKNVVIPTRAPIGPDLFSSPLLMESSALTSKKQFTVVPCSQENDAPDSEINSRRQGNKNLGTIVSALYGKLLIVMGVSFPLAEVISTYIPPSFYDGFYLYLYFGSITFMICIYGNMLRHRATRSVRCTMQRISTMKSKSGNVDASASNKSPEEASSDSDGCLSAINSQHHDSHYSEHFEKQRIHFGSFYLRMGAVAFGIGSMIYSGLEFGQYFELDADTNAKCHNFMIALTPAVRMCFTFMQMYFIFLNSKMAVYKLKLGAQFGLMHMIGTNLCVWLNVLVQETRHEILMFYNPDNGTINYPTPRSHHQGHSRYGGHGYGNNFYPTESASQQSSSIETLSPNYAPMTENQHLLPVNSTIATTIMTVLENHHRVKRGLKGPYSFLECRRSDIMGSLVQNASPFLFPCTIEYSLICAAILYVMWKSMAKEESRKSHHGNFHTGNLSMQGVKRSPNHYSVDCARANKGLFLGIFVLVLTILSLIIFFVLIPHPGYEALAVLEVNITELVLYSMTTIAVLIGMCQMRELRYVRSRNLELDNILLIVSQTGSFIYNVFTLIGGHFTMKMKTNTALVLVTALSSLIQLLFQTLFVLDASKRSISTTEQARRKPGREVVTFLLVTNLAMWAINTLEKSRADSHPVQLKFYGVWAWTIITHISMPLAIFYRFHSTVCLCEIWKRAYKFKPPVYQ